MSKKESIKEQKTSTDKTIGIELPLDWCLVKGSDLRKLQTDLREAQFKADLRLRRLANFYRIIDKARG